MTVAALSVALITLIACTSIGFAPFVEAAGMNVRPALSPAESGPRTWSSMLSLPSVLTITFDVFATSDSVCAEAIGGGSFTASTARGDWRTGEVCVATDDGGGVTVVCAQSATATFFEFEPFATADCSGSRGTRANYSYYATASAPSACRAGSTWSCQSRVMTRNMIVNCGADAPDPCTYFTHRNIPCNGPAETASHDGGLSLTVIIVIVAFSLAGCVGLTGLVAFLILKSRNRLTSSSVPAPTPLSPTSSYHNMSVSRAPFASQFVPFQT